MTQTTPRTRLSRGPRPPRADVRRLGRVYAVDGLCVDAAGRAIPGTEEVIYVGQSRQELKLRIAEHLGRRPQRDGKIKRQSWSDLYLRIREVERGNWDKAKIDEREAHWIRTLKPRYNEKLNEGTPGRIRPIQAAAQRALRNRERDANRLSLRLFPPPVRLALRALADRVAAWTTAVLVVFFVLAVAGSWLPVPGGVWLVVATATVWAVRRWRVKAKTLKGGDGGEVR